MADIETSSVASRDAESDESKPRVQTAFRTVSILLAVSMSTNGLKAKEISDRLDLPRQVRITSCTAS
jgi:hypothetical protein